MNEYIQEKIKIICSIRKGSMDDKQFKATVQHNIEDIYNKGVEDTVKKIAKWVDGNTGGSGDVSYPSLMEFMADTKDIDEAITKLLNK